MSTNKAVVVLAAAIALQVLLVLDRVGPSTQARLFKSLAHRGPISNNGLFNWSPDYDTKLGNLLQALGRIEETRQMMDDAEAAAAPSALEETRRELEGAGNGNDGKYFLRFPKRYLDVMSGPEPQHRRSSPSQNGNS